MRVTAVGFFGLSTLLLVMAAAGSAQQGAATDPRVGLKAGFRDAGQAILNLELVASVPKPDGFFDPGRTDRADHRARAA